MCKISFGYRELVSILKLEELMDFFEIFPQVNGGKNPLVRFIHSNGNMLWMGYSEEGCHLSYQDASLDPPYFSSYNPLLMNNELIVNFYMSDQDHLVEVFKSGLVDFDLLKKVAEYFYLEGKRPEKFIQWKMD